MTDIKLVAKTYLMLSRLPSASVTFPVSFATRSTSWSSSKISQSTSATSELPSLRFGASVSMSFRALEKSAADTLQQS